MKIAMGADHRGREVLSKLCDALRAAGHVIEQMGPRDAKSCDFTDAAYPVGLSVSGGDYDRGILICGTGIGMSISANKIKGIRAALVHDEIGADMSRRHNDSNVLCLSADMLGPRLIEKIVEVWLSTEFDGGRHARRVKKIAAIEEGNDPTTVVLEEDAPAA